MQTNNHISDLYHKPDFFVGKTEEMIMMVSLRKQSDVSEKID